MFVGRVQCFSSGALFLPLLPPPLVFFFEPKCTAESLIRECYTNNTLADSKKYDQARFIHFYRLWVNLLQACAKEIHIASFHRPTATLPTDLLSYDVTITAAVRPLQPNLNYSHPQVQPLTECIFLPGPIRVFHPKRREGRGGRGSEAG